LLVLEQFPSTKYLTTLHLQERKKDSSKIGFGCNQCCFRKNMNALSKSFELKTKSPIYLAWTYLFIVVLTSDATHFISFVWFPQWWLRFKHLLSLEVRVQLSFHILLNNYTLTFTKTQKQLYPYFYKDGILFYSLEPKRMQILGVYFIGIRVDFLLRGYDETRPRSLVWAKAIWVSRPNSRQ